MLLARRQGWGPLFTFIAAVAGYLLVGPAAAAPEQALASVVPTLGSERVLVKGAVESWRSVLTLPVPLGSSQGELVVPFVVALLGGLVATTLLWRSRVPGLVWVPVVAMFAAAAAFGARDADSALIRGILLTSVLLVWLRWRTLRMSRASWVRRGLLGAVVLGVAGSAAWGSGSLVQADTRDVLRDHVEPPLADLDFKSPLARYRDYYKNQKTDVLFTFQNLPAGKPLVRLASMDSFDGLVWNVTSVDRASGTSDFGPAPYLGSGSTVTVTVGAYAGPWVPTVGTATGAVLDHEGGDGGPRQLLINRASGGVAMLGDVRPGDVYQVEWAPRPDETADLATVPADRSVPLTPMTFPAIEKLDKLTQRWVSRVGAASDYEKVVAIEQRFRDDGYFNDGLTPEERGYSASGHSAKRLADLVQDDQRMVGNDEQYAAAMAYAVQRSGIPARVVLGFENIGADGSVTGDDIAAWVEVPFVGHGWAVFDPTPDESRVPPPLQDNPNPEPQPYIVQPPVLPQEPADLQGVPPAGAGQDQTDGGDSVWPQVLAWVWFGTKLVLVLAPLWLVVLLKRLRRRRRRRASDPLERLSGAWREIIDRARDLGTRLPVSDTRLEAALLLETRFPECEHPALAATADRHVFGPGAPDEGEVAAYWADVDTALKRMRRAAPLWRRPLAWFSPSSLQPRAALRRAGRAVVVRLKALGRLPRVRKPAPHQEVNA